MNSPKLSIRNLKKMFPRPGNSGFLDVIEDFNLDIHEGEFVCVIGPSGCGKTTLFNILAGIEQPSQGELLFDGTSIAGKRGLFGYMLQRDVLLPWRTVLDNAQIALEVRGQDRSESLERTRRLLHEYGLGDFEAFYPNALSEGMRQRVALIRTIVCDHQMILFDEPFSSVDYRIRLLLEQQVYDIVRKGRKTALFVTHDIESAVALGDRIVIFSGMPCHVVRDVPVGLAKSNGGPVGSRSAADFGARFAEILRLYRQDNGQE